MKLKKVISVFTTSCLLMTIAGCGDSKPDGMPDPFYKAGVQFINVLDQVLDVEMDYETAYNETKLYVDVMEGYKDEDIKYSLIAANAGTIRLNFSPDNLLGYSEKGLTTLLEDRNDFAEDFNVKAREQ